MKNITEVFERLIEGRRAVKLVTAFTGDDVSGGFRNVGKPLAIKDDSTFNQRLRRVCPANANAYSLRHQFQGDRYVQFYKIPPRMIEGLTLRIEYHSGCEYNCLPGVPK